jgi:acetoacetate decarboxylase
MKLSDVRLKASAMPLTNPSYPPGPYRFYNREFLVVTYRTDLDALRAVVPEPLEVTDPIVKYEFIRMPDSTGFGDYTETGQVIPVTYKGEKGSFVHSMYLDDEAPIAGGREIWGFPKKLASPKLAHENEVLVGTLHYGSVLCAVATMGYKHKILPAEPILRSLDEPSFLIKIIPHVDNTLRVCELVRYHLLDVDLKGAWSGPAALELFQHVMADVAKLPVLEVLSGVHFIADLTLGLGEVVHDYLKEGPPAETLLDASHKVGAAE